MRIGIDIGGSHIAIGVVNNNELILREEKEIKLAEYKEPEQALQDNIIMLINNIMSKIGSEEIELIGLACPRKYK